MIEKMKHRGTVLIIGAGEVASAVAHRLWMSKFMVVMTEVPRPLAVSRGTCFSEAVYDGSKTIEGVTAKLVNPSITEIRRCLKNGEIPVVVDPECKIREKLKPEILVEASMRKRRCEITMKDAPITIGLGPGWCAGKDVHLVVETNHSNNLGRVIEIGKAEENTKIPVSIGGFTTERVVWADRDGIFFSEKNIADRVKKGEIIGRIKNHLIKAPLQGMLRGLLRSGVKVTKGTKLIEIDPLSPSQVSFVIRDKMRAIAGGVLEAILRLAPY